MSRLSSPSEMAVLLTKLLQCSRQWRRNAAIEQIEEVVTHYIEVRGSPEQVLSSAPAATKNKHKSLPIITTRRRKSTPKSTKQESLRPPGASSRAERLPSEAEGRPRERQEEARELQESPETAKRVQETLIDPQQSQPHHQYSSKRVPAASTWVPEVVAEPTVM